MDTAAAAAATADTKTKTSIAEMDHHRIVLHFDVDCFYVACERHLNPQLSGVPVAVSQYNPYGTLQDMAATDVQGRWVVQGTSLGAAATNNNNNHRHNNNDNTNGSLIAVSYEARACRVQRNQRGCEARRLCPQLHIVQVPVKHGKADLTLYRNASKQVFHVLQQAVITAGLRMAEDKETATTTATTTAAAAKSSTVSPHVVVEIASIDEVYMDVTKLVNRMMQQQPMTQPVWSRIVATAAPCTTIGGREVLSEAAQATNTLDKDALRRGSHVQVLDSCSCSTDPGSQAWWQRPLSQFSTMDLRLACGAALAARARQAVQEAFDGGVFTLSAGISTNKTLAKLASGLKKPNRQTLLYQDDTDDRVLQTLFYPLPLSRLRGLGGKWGASIADHFGIQTVGQLAEIPLQRLQQAFPKNATFLFDMARGHCTDPVTPRSRPKSIECSKTFRGPLAIAVRDSAKLQKWIGELCGELEERLRQDQDDYNRRACTMKVSVQFHSQRSFTSKQMRAPKSLGAFRQAATDMIHSLVQSAQMKMSPLEGKQLTITGMGVGGMQFVEFAAGSSSILSFAATGDVAAATTSPVKPCSRRASDKFLGLKRTISQDSKPSGVELWLKQAHTNGDKRIKANEAASSDDCKAASPLTGSETAAPATTLPSLDQIDPEVLKALPEDLQRQVLGDIRYQQSHRKGTIKKGGIQRFFAPRKSNK